jgi:uncharacterized protein (DUF1697 family)
MAVVIGMLRGVNVGGHNKVKMDALRELCASLKLRSACTHLQSGNVVFHAPERSVATLGSKLEREIERAFGFHSDVILRTPAEMKQIIAKNPFAGRPDLDPAKFLVYFLARDPGSEARAKMSKIETGPEELHIAARELYIYFTNGMARPKLSLAAMDRVLKTPATGRNWNTVTKLLEIAEKLLAVNERQST